MDIQPISSNRFVVGLSLTDMAELDITYDDMDYSNIETRRVIWTILDTVRQTTGRDIDPSGNLMIEAAPDPSGGCLLMFTVPQKMSLSGANGTVISKSRSTQIFEFNNLDDLLDAAKATGLKSISGRIFTDGKKYRAEFAADKVSQFSHVLNEYGVLVGKDSLSAAITEEHWRIVKKSTSE